MELRQIIYFIEVARREHVTEAANALHVAQSAVSRQIFNLEAELGVDLFIRKGRNIKLTAIGRVFLQHMEQAMKVMDAAKQVIDEYKDPERGTVHVGFPSSLASYLLPTAISAFRDKYPDVKFQLNQGTYRDLIKDVIKGNINIALLAPVPEEEKRVESSILFTEHVVALLPLQHPLADSPSISLDQLKNDSFVVFPKGYILRDLVDDHCEQVGFKPNVSFEGQDIDAIKGLVSAGLGISLVPEVTLIENRPYATVTVPIMEPAVTRTVGMIIPTDRHLLPTEKLFFEFLLNYFKEKENKQL